MASGSQTTSGNIITPAVEELIKPVEKNLSCIYKECQRTFRHRPALNMHLVQTHKLKGYADYSKKEKRLYLCPVKGCSRSLKVNPFTNMKTIRSHYINMHMEKNLRCGSCGKRFSSEKLLGVHMKSCGKMYVCNMCNVPYASLEGVTKHQQNIHTTVYKRAKALKMHQSCYNVVNSDSVSSKHDDQATSNTKLETGINNHTTINQVITSDTSSTVIVSEKKKSQSDDNDTQSEAIQPSDEHVTGVKCATLRDDLNNRSANKSRIKYIPLLPKPASQVCTLLTVGNKGTYPNRKDMGTQTDLLAAAIRSSNIHLEDQCTSTTDHFQIDHTNNLFTKESECTANSQYAQPNNLPSVVPYYSNGESNIGHQSWAESSCPVRPPDVAVHHAPGRMQYTVPADLATQTSFIEDAGSRSTPNSHLGTQTTLSALLEEVGRSSSSIELQCELGNASLQIPEADECLPTMEEVMSFGTQTNLTVESRPFNDTPRIHCTSTGVSSFGTQTTTAPNDDELGGLEIPESFPLQHSTSDFSMQFPYNLMDFGTQTPLLDSDGGLSGAFMFDDELLNDQPTSSTAQLSQSSTQTDLDFLFNHIETQTDWQI